MLEYTDFNFWRANRCSKVRAVLRSLSTFCCFNHWGTLTPPHRTAPALLPGPYAQWRWESVQNSTVSNSCRRALTVVGNRWLPGESPDGGRMRIRRASSDFGRQIGSFRGFCHAASGRDRNAPQRSGLICECARETRARSARPWAFMANAGTNGGSAELLASGTGVLGRPSKEELWTRDSPVYSAQRPL
jgi:hypothetical protein